MKTFQGKLVSYMNTSRNEVYTSNLNGDFYAGFTVLDFSNLTEDVEGKDLVYDVMLKELVKYKDQLKAGYEIEVNLEWDIKDDFSEYLACRILNVRVCEMGEI